MIRLAAANCSLPKLGPKEAAEAFRSCGFRLLEMQTVPGFTFSLDEFSRESLIAEMGMELIAIYPSPVDVHSPERFAESVAYGSRCLSWFDDLVVFSPLLPREGYDYARLAEGLRLLLDAGAKRIAVENHAGWPMSEPDDYARLFDLVADDRVGMTLDTGHYTAVGVDPLEVAQRFRDRLMHVHLKDQIGDRPVPFGQGETRNREVLDYLRETGYTGYATLELELPDAEDPVGELKSAVEVAVRTLDVEL